MRSKTIPIDAAVPRAGYDSVIAHSFGGRYAAGRDPWTTEAATGRPARVLRDQLRRPSRILDVGTGKGRDVVRLLDAGHWVTGVDLHEPEEWTPIRQRWGHQVRFERASLLAWTDTQIFDAALDNGCFHHQHPDDYAAYLAAIHARLVPDGVLVASVFTPYRKQRAGGYFTTKDGGRLNRYFTEDELGGILGSAGFTWQSSERIYRPSCHRFYLVAIARRT